MKTSKTYTAESIEVLSGLEPVKRRPGMYTDTTNPNHLAREAIDNSVDEAMEGHATSVAVTLYKDGSLEITDDGRGMPVDMHPEEKLTGVELILTRLHSGAKFSNKQYRFSGGLHGVGISVVNALSKKLEVVIKRDGKIYQINFAHGDATSKLKTIGTTNNKRVTGTSVRFWPEEKYFDTPKFVINKLKYVLRAKAVLCPGLHASFHDETTGEINEWHYEDGLKHYLMESVGKSERIPDEPFTGSFAGTTEMVDWAAIWLPEDGEVLSESYVNLIPTAQGGTHVNGFRLGLLEALVEAHLVWLAAIALLFAIIGAYYYLRIVMLMYFEEPADKSHSAPIVLAPDMMVAISINGSAALFLGLLPSTFIDLCRLSFS